jgi:hypothetical protein
MIQRRALRRSLILLPVATGLVLFGFRTPLHNAIIGRRQSRCSDHLREIGRAMDEFHKKYGHFPPAYIADPDGEPIHSWRVLLLEFLDPTLFKAYNFNEPWNGPRNTTLLRKMPLCYMCPNHDDDEQSCVTSYVVIVGAETVFPESGSKKITEIEDRVVGTILVAEVALLDIPWMEPRDLKFDQMSFRINDSSQPSISSSDPDGAGVVLVGGAVHRLTRYSGGFREKEFIKAEMDFTRALITSNGAELAYFDDSF